MAYRTFWTADGREWQVWDVDPSWGSARLPHALSGAWLCFQTEGEKRRLHPAPACWAECSEAELQAMQARADAVQPRAGRPSTAA